MNANASNRPASSTLFLAANLAREISGLARVDSLESGIMSGLGGDSPADPYAPRLINGNVVRFLAPHEDAGVDLDDDPEYHDPEYWASKAEYDREAREDR
jgi:hypothetical protein